jgi:hypothetical protein
MPERDGMTTRKFLKTPFATNYILATRRREQNISQCESFTLFPFELTKFPGQMNSFIFAPVSNDCSINFDCFEKIFPYSDRYFLLPRN